MNKFPFISRVNSLTLLRGSVAIIFLAHSSVRFAGATVAQFDVFLESKGFPFGVAWI